MQPLRNNGCMCRVVRTLPHTKVSKYSFYKTLLMMDRWGPKHIELKLNCWLKLIHWDHIVYLVELYIYILQNDTRTLQCHFLSYSLRTFHKAIHIILYSSNADLRIRPLSRNLYGLVEDVSLFYDSYYLTKMQLISDRCKFYRTERPEKT